MMNFRGSKRLSLSLSLVTLPFCAPKAGKEQSGFTAAAVVVQQKGLRATLLVVPEHSCELTTLQVHCKIKERFAKASASLPELLPLTCEVPASDPYLFKAT